MIGNRDLCRFVTLKTLFRSIPIVLETSLEDLSTAALLMDPKIQFNIIGLESSGGANRMYGRNTAAPPGNQVETEKTNLDSWHQEKSVYLTEFSYQYFLTAILILLFIFSGVSCMATDEPARKTVFGGQCEYKKYEGQARIISVRKKELPNESYEVKFCFHTDEIIVEAYGQVEGKEYLLLLDNSSYPGAKFLKKYGIEKGKYFDCYLKVITRGTCTPVLFYFPTIDLSDYSENRE